MSRQHKVSPLQNKDLKEKISNDDKCNNKINYITAGPDKQEEMEASAKLPKLIYQELVIFQPVGALKHILFASKRWYKTSPSPNKIFHICTPKAPQKEDCKNSR